MFLYNAYVFFSLATTLLMSIKLVPRYKDGLKGMNGMIISMFLGMNTGLTSGVLLGAVLQGDLFLSTILSMLIGAAAGATLGVLFNSAAAIEGFMSGMMGGMMGAMLGEMLLPEDSLVLINIFLMMTVSSFFLFKVLPKSQSSITSKKYIMKPALILILLVIYLSFGSLLGHNWIKSFPLSNEHDLHMHHP